MFTLEAGPSDDAQGPAPDVHSGYLATRGAQIVDRATGEPVRLVGANWFGAEGKTMIPNGLWARNYMDMMDEMAEAGINLLRLPISPGVLSDQIVTDGLRKDINPDLVGLTPIEVMDAIVEYAGQIGIRVVLDMHRRDPGRGKQEDGLWFSDDYTIEDMAADWQAIAGRYAGDPTVIGADVFNEPSGRARWGDEASRPELDWAAAAETLGNAILEANPDLLILVQGMHVVDERWYWVGGNLRGARERPIELDVEGRLVYSPHDYPRSVVDVPWLRDATPEQMVQLFRKHWGYLAEEGIAPVLIGETGARMDDPEDAAYLDALFGYLEGLADASPGGTGGAGVAWWGWNPNSHDTGGLLGDDWRTLHEGKLAYLDGLDPSPLPANEAALERMQGEARTLVLEADAAKGHERVFTYEVSSGTATEGTDFVARDGVIQLPPGETRAEIALTVLRDAQMDGPESVVVTIRWAHGGTHSVHEVALSPPEPEREPEPAPKPEVTVTDEDHGSLVLVEDDETLVVCVQTVDAERVRVAIEDEGLRADTRVEVRASDPDALTLVHGDATGDRVVLGGSGEAGGLGFEVRIEASARFAETPNAALGRLGPGPRRRRERHGRRGRGRAALGRLRDRGAVGRGVLRPRHRDQHGRGGPFGLAAGARQLRLRAAGGAQGPRGDHGGRRAPRACARMGRHALIRGELHLRRGRPDARRPDRPRPRRRDAGPRVRPDLRRSRARPPRRDRGVARGRARGHGAVEVRHRAADLGRHGAPEVAAAAAFPVGGAGAGRQAQGRAQMRRDVGQEPCRLRRDAREVEREHAARERRLPADEDGGPVRALEASGRTQERHQAARGPGRPRATGPSARATRRGPEARAGSRRSADGEGPARWPRPPPPAARSRRA